MKDFLVPYVVEETGHGERGMDIFSRLLRERIVFIGTPIDDHVAGLIVAQLVFLESESSTKDINVYINTPGGSVTAGLAIYDTMRYIKPYISTICVGMAASMGAILLAGGTKGKRHSLPNSRIMIHQPWTQGIGGQVSDVEIHARELLKTRDVLYKLLSRDTGKSPEEIEKACDRDNFLDPQAAVDFGIIDHIIEKRTA